jgi:hypothetical protein
MLTEWHRQNQALERTASWTLEELSRWTNELRDMQNLDFLFSQNWRQ